MLKRKSQSNPGMSIFAMGMPPKYRGRRFNVHGVSLDGEGLATDGIISVATANVCTLHPKDARKSAGLGDGLMISGRTAILENMFNEVGYTLIGIQESRLQENSIRFSS